MTRDAMSKNHYYKTKLLKMGVWALLPGDCDVWHTQESARFFEQRFGISKGLLVIFTLDSGLQHAYVPEAYIAKLYKRIQDICQQDCKTLESMLKLFYPLRNEGRIAVSRKALRDYSGVSNIELAKRFVFMRTWIRKVTVFDQFGWLGEDYWKAPMRDVLTEKLGLEEGSAEYNAVLFSLTKPEEISSTLADKRGVLREVIKIKHKETTELAASKRLAKKYGWMPVFCFGEPWNETRYMEEIQATKKRHLGELDTEYNKLKNYAAIRNREIKGLVKRYNISPRDLQIFIDFGLALDTRNEAEYFVSFAGPFLMPMYREIAKRLYCTTEQIRLVYENKMIECLLGKKDITKLLPQKGTTNGFGFSEDMKTFYYYPPKEARPLFNYIESYVENVQGGDEAKGTCASPGKARGKIRIVPSPEFNSKVKNGDILVTYSTTVDYLPAMKRAAAIITEVGGLTCHAAVVSREFGIPCVVALKNAMKNFKDGDLVEVDADKGFVKKITK